MHPPNNPDSTIISPADLAFASLSLAAVLLSLASASTVLYLRLITSDLFPLRHRRRRLSVLNSLWPIRLLLVLFASLFPLSSLLRLPFLRPKISCHAYILSSYAFSQPAFLATLLFLLRATTNPSPSSGSLSSAFSAALFSSLPFLALHALFLSHYVLPLRHIGLPQDIFGQGEAAAADVSCCCYPLFGTVLLGAVYVPLFVSSGWGAVSVVINKKLRLRLYVLVATVVAGVPLQVAALAVSALLAPGHTACQLVGFVAFFAVLACTVAGVVILVGQPIVDALAVADERERGFDGWEGSNAAELVAVRTDDDVARADG